MVVQIAMERLTRSETWLLCASLTTLIAVIGSFILV
jgi:hypothetical protein